MTAPDHANAPALILIPTDLERRKLKSHRLLSMEGCEVAVCGFGPVAAAARTSQLLAQLRPSSVILLGIAGSFDTVAFPINAAKSFGNVRIHGIGAGEGECFQPAAQLGFAQLVDPEKQPPQTIGDCINLSMESSDDLLTVCAASGSSEMAARRKQRYPAVIAEDMEGYGVALACQLAGAKLTIIRGASNVVGDRDASTWSIGPALLAAADLAVVAIERDRLGAVDHD